MKSHSLIPILTLSLLAPGFAQNDASIETVLVSETGSERATVGAGNLIVTASGKTHAVWQEADARGYRSVIRTLDHASGQWSEPLTLNAGKDNHARPYLTLDSDGFLHVVTSGHNTPFLHRKSTRPHDTSAWEKAVSFGSGTYPYLLAGPEGSLLLAARSAKHGGVDLYRKGRDGAWETIRPLILKRHVQSIGYAGYNSVLQWGPGLKRLHFACDVYEGKTRGEIQMVVHQYSDDLGATWHRSDGSLVSSSAHPDQMDVLARDIRKRANPMAEPSVRLGGMIVDQASGRPVVLLTEDAKSDRGKASLWMPDSAGQWQEMGLNAALREQVPELGALGPAGGFTQTSSGALRMIIPMAPRADWGLPEKKNIRPETIQLIRVETRDLGKTYLVRPLFPHSPGKEAVERHAFSLEKPGGFNHPADSGTPFVFFEGLKRYRIGKEVIQTRVHYGELQ